MKQFYAAALIFAVSFSTPVAAEEISITDMNWDAARVISQVLKQTIETHLGETVVIRKGNTEESLVSMDAGDGKFDIFPDIWMPNRQDAWEKYVDDRKTIRSNGGYAALQAFFLPTNVASRFNIKDISDLNDQKIAKLFDTDGDGLGEYWAGEEGWSVTQLNQIKIKSYGLDKLWEPWVTSNEYFKKVFIKATEEERPILFYYWTPESIFKTHDLQRLTEPTYTKNCSTVFTPDDREDWLEASRFACEFETSRVYIFYSSSLETRAPAVSSFLENVEFNIQVLNAWVTEIGINGRDPADVAHDWLAANQTVVNGWLNISTSN